MRASGDFTGRGFACSAIFRPYRFQNIGGRLRLAEKTRFRRLLPAFRRGRINGGPHVITRQSTIKVRPISQAENLLRFRRDRIEGVLLRDRLRKLLPIHARLLDDARRLE